MCPPSTSVSAEASRRIRPRQAIQLKFCRRGDHRDEFHLKRTAAEDSPRDLPNCADGPAPLMAARCRPGENRPWEGAVSDQKKNARCAVAVLFGINFMNLFDRQIAGALGEPTGRLTDRWSRKRLIALGVTVWSLLTAASGLAWNFTTFASSRISIGEAWG
jgi:hypothetical protein